MTSAVELRQLFLKIRGNKVFELFVIGVIIVSALLIGAKTYYIHPQVEQILRILDVLITVIFLVEIIIRMVADGKLSRFFRNGWNVFDFVIVTASLIPIDESEMALLARLLRVFRILRLVSIIPELRILMNALVKAIPRMGYVVLLMFIIFYIYGAMGSMLFEKINPTLWENISISMLTLFRVATFEDWTDVMYETMTVYPLSWLYYLSFIFLTAFVFLNMMIGIVLDVLQTEHEKYNQEQGLGEAGEVHWIREHSELMEQRLERIEEMLKQMKRD
ncbi:MAG: ion transporter [Gammaproteobacteria bacterium]|nr:ion transporter [Gammaproteobacteria bacterium]